MLAISAGELRVRLMPLLCIATSLLVVRLAAPYIASLCKRRRKPPSPGSIPLQALARSIQHFQEGPALVPLPKLLYGLAKRYQEGDGSGLDTQHPQRGRCPPHRSIASTAPGECR